VSDSEVKGSKCRISETVRGRALKFLWHIVIPKLFIPETEYAERRNWGVI